ncbi:NEDD8-activating enzyme E1 regulatory subunit, partial [Fasciolopsis buskii]
SSYLCPTSRSLYYTSVRNAAFLRVVRSRSLEEEMKLSPARSEDLGEHGCKKVMRRSCCNRSHQQQSSLETITVYLLSVVLTDRSPDRHTLVILVISRLHFSSALIPTHKENDAMLWYIVLRGASSFLMETGRWPGSPVPYTVRAKKTSELAGDQFSEPARNTVDRPSSESDSHQQITNPVRDTKHLMDSDLPAFRTHLNRVLRSFGITPNRISWDYVNEMCRFGGGELHSVSAFMGGIVAQEVIKLITHQFVPISKPLVYNAITQRVELLDF